MANFHSADSNIVVSMQCLCSVVNNKKVTHSLLVNYRDLTARVH